MPEDVCAPRRPAGWREFNSKERVGLPYGELIAPGQLARTAVRAFLEHALGPGQVAVWYTPKSMAAAIQRELKVTYRALHELKGLGIIRILSRPRYLELAGELGARGIAVRRPRACDNARSFFVFPDRLPDDLPEF